MSERIYPNHVAIILDGNRRWAKKRNLPTLKGHQEGAMTLSKLVPYVFSKGTKVLTVYAFSCENFKRSEEEVKYLMDLFVDNFTSKLDKIVGSDIRIVFSGRRENLRDDVINAMDSLEGKTKDHTGGILNICLNYGGQQEIVDATKKIVSLVENGKLKVDDITEENYYKYLYIDLPPIDFMIRTSGEIRISNFLLYQLSYAEFYFTDVYFPDFNREQYEIAIDEYNKRQRRYGGNK